MHGESPFHVVSTPRHNRLLCSQRPPRFELLAHRALCDCSLPLAAMFAGLPPSSSELPERKGVVPPSRPADRRREHRESAAVVVTRRGKNARPASTGSLRSLSLALLRPLASVRRRAISRRSQLSAEEQP